MTSLPVLEAAATSGTWPSLFQLLSCCQNAKETTETSTSDGNDIKNSPHSIKKEYIKHDSHMAHVECCDSEEDIINSFEYLNQKKEETYQKEQLKNEQQILEQKTQMPPDSDVTAILRGIVHYDSQKVKLVIYIERVDVEAAISSTTSSSIVEGPTTYQLSGTLSPSHRPLFRTNERPLKDLTFKEEFDISLQSDEVLNSQLRMQLFQVNFTPGKQVIVGECTVSLQDPRLANSTAQYFPFYTRKNPEAVDNSSTTAMSETTSELSMNINIENPFQEEKLESPSKNQSQLQIGLKYDIGVGRLMVQIIQGCNIQSRGTGKKAPDSYVKVVVLNSSGKELNHSKTSIRKADSHPAFNESFIFHVAQFQLANVTLHFSVYQRKPLNRKDMLGWFTLGHKSSGTNEEEHWNVLKSSPSELVTKWHTLLNKR